MQTKSSYRVLKWTFIFGAMASLGTACVVTSGDGTLDGEGGESGSAAEAGKSSTTAGSGGTSSAGKGGSGGGSAGTTTTTAGAGGEGEVYMPGLCDKVEPNPLKGVTSTMFPSCGPAANDAGNDCKTCLKEECCNAWQVCYGSDPHIACGWGPTDADDDLGQWDCLQNCFVDNDSEATDPAELLATCSAACTNQCEADDGGNILVATSELIECANDPATCQAECFPF